MVFSSFVFLLGFLPVTLIGYALCPRRFQNFFLCCASLFFYAWGEPVYVLVLLLSIAFNFALGLLIERAKQSVSPRISPQWLLAFDVFFNIGLLCIFKYTDFLLDTINALCGWQLPLPGIPLPIGISFYTFQTLSYVIDVYRGIVPAQHSLISFGAYVAMFPQLIAGPIVQYKTIAKELGGATSAQKFKPVRTVSTADYTAGISRFVIGLAKKVILANSIGALFDEISSYPAGLSVAGAWLGAIAFTFQIYFDFSGYSDMAIGLGRMLGFHFLENFDHPYVSTSITEFWRRWHISLGTWFREYVYIPLGGNRRGFARQCVNIFIVWFLTGLWHGASANFVIWGLYYALLLMGEKLFLNRILISCPIWLRWLYTMVLVILGWAIFALPDPAVLLPYIKALFGIGVPLATDAVWYYAKSRGVLLLLCAVCSLPLHFPDKKQDVAPDKPLSPEATRSTFHQIVHTVFLLLLFVVSIAFLVAESYNPFLYFRF